MLIRFMIKNNQMCTIVFPAVTAKKVICQPSANTLDLSVENSNKGQATDIYERSADEAVRGLFAPVSAIFFILNNLITIESHVANVPQKVRVANVQKMEFFQFLYRLYMQNAQSRQPESYTQDFSYSTDEIKFSRVVGHSNFELIQNFMHMPSRVFDIFQELFELIQDTPRISN